MSTYYVWAIEDAAITLVTTVWDTERGAIYHLQSGARNALKDRSLQLDARQDPDTQIPHRKRSRRLVVKDDEGRVWGYIRRTTVGHTCLSCGRKRVSHGLCENHARAWRKANEVIRSKGLSPGQTAAIIEAAKRLELELLEADE